MDEPSLKKTIKMYDFALIELNLYLDTHPDCVQALEYFNQYRKLRNEAYDEYIERYGIYITANQSRDVERWSWIDDPWPWERSAD